MSEGAGCHAGVTRPRAPGTSNGTPAKNGGPAPSLRKTEADSKASSGRRKQTAMGGLCKQLLDRPALGLPCRKKPVCTPGSGSRWAPRVFCPQELSTVQTGLGSRALSCRAHDGTAVWRLAGRSLGVWEPSLGAGPQGPMSLQNDLPASAPQLGVTLSPQAAGNAIFLGGRKGSPRELVFRPLSCNQCVAPQTPDLQACSRASIPESEPGVCLQSASLSNTFLGQCSPAHGEGGSGSASEGARCHAGVTWLNAPGTSHVSLASGGGPAPGVPNAGVGSKASSGKRSKQPWEAFGSKFWVAPC